jgi:hypothetical protein
MQGKEAIETGEVAPSDAHKNSKNPVLVVAVPLQLHGVVYPQ